MTGVRRARPRRLRSSGRSHSSVADGPRRRPATARISRQEAVGRSRPGRRPPCAGRPGPRPCRWSSARRPGGSGGAQGPQPEAGRAAVDERGDVLALGRVDRPRRRPCAGRRPVDHLDVESVGEGPDQRVGGVVRAGARHAEPGRRPRSRDRSGGSRRSGARPCRPGAGRGRTGSDPARRPPSRAPPGCPARAATSATGSSAGSVLVATTRWSTPRPTSGASRSQHQGRASGRPPSSISTLPGRRVEPIRAWTTATRGHRAAARMASASRSDAAPVAPSTGAGAWPRDQVEEGLGLALVGDVDGHVGRGRGHPRRRSRPRARPGSSRAGRWPRCRSPRCRGGTAG